MDSDRLNPPDTYAYESRIRLSDSRLLAAP